MRIALQISGRLRYTDACVASMKAAIIEPLQPDVFCSFWLPERMETVHRYTDEFTPTLMEFEDQNRLTPYMDQLFSFNVWPNLPKMSYKFYRAAMLRRSYEIANRFRYDVIIQARSDNVFMEKLDHARCQLSIDEDAILCNNQLYSENIDPHVDAPRMADNFFLGPTLMMDKSSESFWTMNREVYKSIAALRFHDVAIAEILQTKAWKALDIKIGSLPGTGAHGNFDYDIDRSETEWK